MTGPLDWVTVTAPAILVPHRVSPRARVDLSGPPMVVPLAHSAPPAATDTGPVTLLPGARQMAWPLAMVSDPLMVVVMHGWVNTTETVVLALAEV